MNIGRGVNIIEDFEYFRCRFDGLRCDFHSGDFKNRRWRNRFGRGNDFSHIRLQFRNVCHYVRNDFRKLLDDPGYLRRLRIFKRIDHGGDFFYGGRVGNGIKRIHNRLQSLRHFGNLDLLRYRQKLLRLYNITKVIIIGYVRNRFYNTSGYGQRQCSRFKPFAELGFYFLRKFGNLFARCGGLRAFRQSAHMNDIGDKREQFRRQKLLRFHVLHQLFQFAGADAAANGFTDGRQGGLLRTHQALQFFLCRGFELDPEFVAAHAFKDLVDVGGVRRHRRAGNGDAQIDIRGTFDNRRNAVDGRHLGHAFFKFEVGLFVRDLHCDENRFCIDGSGEASTLAHYIFFQCREERLADNMRSAERVELFGYADKRLVWNIEGFDRNAFAAARGFGMIDQLLGGRINKRIAYRGRFREVVVVGKRPGWRRSGIQLTQFFRYRLCHLVLKFGSGNSDDRYK